jgi:hypothetical protein
VEVTGESGSWIQIAKTEFVHANAQIAGCLDDVEHTAVVELVTILGQPRIQVNALRIIDQYS